MMRYVRMKELKTLVRDGVVKVVGGSDDGEFIRFKVLPSGPEIGQWYAFGQKLLVVDCETIHENIVKSFPQLYEECSK